MRRVGMRLLLVVSIMARRLFSVARMPRGRAAFAHRGAIQFLLVDPSIDLLARVDVSGPIERGNDGSSGQY